MRRKIKEKIIKTFNLSKTILIYQIISELIWIVLMGIFIVTAVPTKQIYLLNKIEMNYTLFTFIIIITIFGTIRLLNHKLSLHFDKLLLCLVWSTVSILLATIIATQNLFVGIITTVLLSFTTIGFNVNLIESFKIMCYKRNSCSLLENVDWEFVLLTLDKINLNDIELKIINYTKKGLTNDKIAELLSNETYTCDVHTVSRKRKKYIKKINEYMSKKQNL